MARTESDEKEAGLLQTQTDELAGGSDDVSKQWLALTKTSEQTALATVRKFVHIVEEAIPLDVTGVSRRRELIDGALEMTERLIHTQYDLMRSAVRSAVLVDVDVGVDVNVNVDVASRESTTQFRRRSAPPFVQTRMEPMELAESDTCVLVTNVTKER